MCLSSEAGSEVSDAVSFPSKCHTECIESYLADVDKILKRYSTAFGCMNRLVKNIAQFTDEIKEHQLYGNVHIRNLFKSIARISDDVSS